MRIGYLDSAKSITYDRCRNVRAFLDGVVYFITAPRHAVAKPFVSAPGLRRLRAEAPALITVS